MTVKPFKISNQWVEYAHGPGAEDAQPLAVELVELVTDQNGGTTEIPATRRDLVEEVISVAELYTSHSSVQDDDRLWFRGYPSKVIKRARAWLREQGDE